MNNIITPEMENHLKAELNTHIKGVINCARELFNRGYIDKSILEKITHHDESKFQEPEYTPYVKRRWEEYKNPGKDYHEMSDDIKEAIVHHVTHNDHHPEFWSKDYQGFKSDAPCHIDYMPIGSIVEMACDWYDMGNAHNNKAIDWFNKTNETRWIWNPKLSYVIKNWLNLVDNLNNFSDRVNKLFN